MRSFVRNLKSYGLLSLAFVFMSCGSSSTDGSNGAGVNNFVGTWKFTSGTITVTCPDPIGVLTAAESGNVTVSKGATSDIIVTSDQCSLKFDVAASTATAQPGQSCTTVDSSGTEVDSYDSAVVTTTDGVTAHFSASVTAAITISGASVTCTGTETADMLKL